MTGLALFPRGGRVGYRVEHEGVYRIWNIILVTPLIVASAPLMAIIALALLVCQGRPVFYRGERLGKDRKTFNILKFRTLRAEAGQLTRNQVLPASSNMETRLGKYLRFTRLDELPQLLNVLKGDMNLIGPRPVRRTIADQLALELPNYNFRFSVKPGLVGYSQAVMTHGTSKRIRHRWNLLLCRSRVNYRSEITILFITAWNVLERTAQVIAARAWLLFKGVSTERRSGRRSEPASATVRVIRDGVEVAVGKLDNISDKNFVFHSPVRLQDGQCEFILRRQFRNSGITRQARCKGAVLFDEYAGLAAGKDAAGKNGETRYSYLARYEPTTDLQFYMIDNYFLGNAIVRRLPRDLPNRRIKMGRPRHGWHWRRRQDVGYGEAD